MVRLALAVDALSLPLRSLGVPWGDLLRDPDRPTDFGLYSGPNAFPGSEGHSDFGTAESGTSPADTFDADTVEADRLEELAREITSISSMIESATHRLLTLLADFDSRRGWEREGHRSCAHWLAYRTGIDLGAARERVRTARSLICLPEIGAAMARGELSFSKVRALTRVATPDDEGELLAFALENTASSVERAVRGWKTRNRTEEAEWERLRHESRSLSVFPDDEGMYVVRGKLDPEVGTLLMRAIEAASDALYRKDAKGEKARSAMMGRDVSEREAAQRRADAIGLLAERAMGAGFGEVGDDSAPISGSRAERYQVVLHVEDTTLNEEGEPGRSELEEGVRVSAEPSGRVCVEQSEQSCSPRDHRAKRDKRLDGYPAMPVSYA